MSDCPFCNPDSASTATRRPSADPTPRDSQRPAGLVRHGWRTIQWLFPSTMLVLIPKCPMCVAAYVAMFTGIGVSVSTARWIQILGLTLCVVSLVYLAGRHWRNKLRSVMSCQNRHP